jgi:hypothetical protein
MTSSKSRTVIKVDKMEGLVLCIHYLGGPKNYCVVTSHSFEGLGKLMSGV